MLLHSLCRWEMVGAKIGVSQFMRREDLRDSFIYSLSEATQTGSLSHSSLVVAMKLLLLLSANSMKILLSCSTNLFSRITYFREANTDKRHQQQVHCWPIQFPIQFIWVGKYEAYLWPMCDTLVIFASVTATFRLAISMLFVGLNCKWSQVISGWTRLNCLIPKQGSLRVCGERRINSPSGETYSSSTPFNRVLISVDQWSWWG